MATPTTTPLTAHLTSQPPTSVDHHVNHEEIHLSRAQVPWSPEVWARIDRAVAHEVRRTRKATFIPQRRVGHHVTNVEQDVVLQNLNPGSPVFVPPRAAIVVVGAPTPPTLNIYEGANLTVIELSVKWALSHAQVKKEGELHQGMHGGPEAHTEQPAHPEHPRNPEHPGHAEHSGHHEHHPSSTAVLLARRTANTLCLGVDALVWLGSNAFPAPAAGGAPAVPGIPLFSSLTVLFNGIPADTGLTCIGGPNTPLEVLTVTPANAVAPGGAATPALYSTNTVAKISQAVTDLAASGYGGPYAAVLPPYFYAESFFPLGNTLQRPADIIKPLLDAGYHDSAVMPGVSSPVTPPPVAPPPGLGFPGLTNASAQGVGFVVSLGGNVVEFVNGLDPVTAFSQIDGNGNYIF